MPNEPIQRHLTARDEELLLALDRCPLTVQQILKLSQTFPGHPFHSPRSVQDRLQKLREAGWVRRWTYAIPARGAAPDYYKLTLLGYRLIYGFDAAAPTKRAFSETGIAFQHHSHSLAEFIVHSLVAAHRSGIHLLHFAREHTLRFFVGETCLCPDCAFDLHSRDGRQFHYRVELDNGTERVRSDKDTDSWQRKIRLYEELQDRSAPSRFRVIVVATRSRDRLRNILSLAGALARNPDRSLFYGTTLDRYLGEPDALHQPCFLDHRLRPASLLPSPPAGASPNRLPLLGGARRICSTLAIVYCLVSEATWETTMVWPPSARTASPHAYHLLKPKPAHFRLL